MPKRKQYKYRKFFQGIRTSKYSRLKYYDALAQYFAEQSEWEYYEIYRQQGDDIRAARKELDNIVVPMTKEFVSCNKTLIIQ